MDDINWLGLISAGVGLLALVWAVVKYALDRHAKSVYETIAHNRAEHRQRMSSLEDSHQAHVRLLIDTRDELHTHYVRNEQLDKDIGELKDIMAKVFGKLDTISADLNKMIGQQRRASDEH